jgi:hypothetical protein
MALKWSVIEHSPIHIQYHRRREMLVFLQLLWGSCPVFITEGQVEPLFGRSIRLLSASLILG